MTKTFYNNTELYSKKPMMRQVHISISTTSFWTSPTSMLLVSSALWETDVARVIHDVIKNTKIIIQ